MAPVRCVRHAHLLVVTLSLLFQCLPLIGSAEKIAASCWRCGDIFVMLEHATRGECPTCHAACRLSEDTGLLALHCMDSGSDSCAFILHCPDRSTVVFSGGSGGNGQRIVDYLKQLGTEEITALIGADKTNACMQSLTGIMKQFKVLQLFDPGFKNEGGLYADYLKTLRTGDVNYRVVRAMENISCGAVRFYIMKPSSFNADTPDEKGLSLCVVHGGNSFLLSERLHGQGAAIQQLPAFPAADVPRVLFEGASAPLKAVGSPYRGGGPIVLQSDGRAIGVRSLRQISIISSRDDNKSAPAPAVQPEAPSRSSKAAGARQGKININTASVTELDDALSGIAAKKAGTIVQFRKTHGPFRSIEDIKNVPGIGEKLFERNKDRICVR
ncbi:MAG: helix-hairpin-helix domain-containing protein [Candidatus Aureabacteria bacterium]|nr:helix-hairpin-helix domain-containing protein [Candidatus Auribacterota bacterium]